MFLTLQAIRLCNFTEEKWSGRRESNPQLSAWESKFSILYFQYLQNRAEKMYVHSLHTVHALPDLRIAAGRLRDGFHHPLLFTAADLRLTFLWPKKADIRGLP